MCDLDGPSLLGAGQVNPWNPVEKVESRGGISSSQSCSEIPIDTPWGYWDRLADRLAKQGIQVKWCVLDYATQSDPMRMAVPRSFIIIIERGTEGSREFTLGLLDIK